MKKLSKLLALLLVALTLVTFVACDNTTPPVPGGNTDQGDAESTTSNLKDKLIFTVGYEGSGKGGKFVVITNVSNEDVDLSNVYVGAKLSSKDSPSLADPNAEIKQIPLGNGLLASGSSVIVHKNNDDQGFKFAKPVAEKGVPEFADRVENGNFRVPHKDADWNGNDAVMLFDGDTMIDIVAEANAEHNFLKKDTVYLRQYSESPSAALPWSTIAHKKVESFVKGFEMPAKFYTQETANYIGTLYYTDKEFVDITKTLENVIPPFDINWFSMLPVTVKLDGVEVDKITFPEGTTELTVNINGKDSTITIKAEEKMKYEAVSAVPAAYKSGLKEWTDIKTTFTKDREGISGKDCPGVAIGNDLTLKGIVTVRDRSKTIIQDDKDSVILYGGFSETVEVGDRITVSVKNAESVVKYSWDELEICTTKSGNTHNTFKVTKDTESYTPTLYYHEFANAAEVKAAGNGIGFGNTNLYRIPCETVSEGRDVTLITNLEDGGVKVTIKAYLKNSAQKVTDGPHVVFAHLGAHDGLMQLSIYDTDLSIDNPDDKLI